MEELQAQIRILNDVLRELYADMNNNDKNFEKYETLKGVCSKIYKIQDPLFKKIHEIDAQEQPKRLEKLMELLKNLNASDLPENYDEYIKNDEIETLACSTLIGSNGECLWDNHDLLNKNGFSVFAGERDRFGWLTGCIQTEKGIIVYG
jgi:hypothetical protein